MDCRHRSREHIDEFLRASELKRLIMAHLVVKRDVKLDGDGMIPDLVYLGHFGTPDPRARVLFRKRID